MAPYPRLPKPQSRFGAQPGQGATGTGAGRDTPQAGDERSQFEKDRQGRMQGSGGDRPPVYTPPTDYRGGYSNRSIPVAKKSMALGGGGRFAALTAKLEASGKSKESADAIAASIGRRKLGAAKFNSLAAKGRRRAQ